MNIELTFSLLGFVGVVLAPLTLFIDYSDDKKKRNSVSEVELEKQSLLVNDSGPTETETAMVGEYKTMQAEKNAGGGAAEMPPGAGSASRCTRTASLGELLKNKDIWILNILLIICWMAFYFITPVMQTYVVVVLEESNSRLQWVFVFLSLGYMVAGPFVVYSISVITIGTACSFGLLVAALGLILIPLRSFIMQIVASYLIGFGVSWMSMPWI
eukprot:UN27836